MLKEHMTLLKTKLEEFFYNIVLSKILELTNIALLDTELKEYPYNLICRKI